MAKKEKVDQKNDGKEQELLKKLDEYRTSLYGLIGIKIPPPDELLEILSTREGKELTGFSPVTHIKSRRGIAELIYQYNIMDLLLRITNQQAELLQYFYDVTSKESDKNE